MSDFHSITPYGSKVCHGSMMGVTACISRQLHVARCSCLDIQACTSSELCSYMYIHRLTCSCKGVPPHSWAKEVYVCLLESDTDGANGT